MIKTMTFALTHFTVAFTVVWLLTGDLLIGSLIALVEPAINTVAYFFHERFWKRFEAKTPAPGINGSSATRTALRAPVDNFRANVKLVSQIP
ncbi:DUF2061 domain-containing protein [Marinobacter sp.]